MEERITTAGIAFIDNMVLVGKRKEGGPLSLKWEFPGGKNRYGESICDTLIREWMEELSVLVEVKELIFETEFENKGTHYYLKCHRVVPLSQDFKLHEHIEIGLASKDELSKLEFGESDGKIRDYLVANWTSLTAL